MKRYAFTLVEILIVLVIFGMLSGIMLKTYTTITKVSFRIAQDKELAKESLILSQVLDNISQTATIDYEKYEERGYDLSDSSQGFVDKLYLTGDIWTGTEIYSSGNCAASADLYDEDYVEKKDPGFIDTCKLVLKRNGEETVLLGDIGYGSGEYHVSEIKFRVIPYNTTKKIIEEGAEYSPGQPAFWIIGAIYSKFYNPKKWSNSSIQPIQFFYGLKGETPNIYSSES